MIQTQGTMCLTQRQKRCMFPDSLQKILGQNIKRGIHIDQACYTIALVQRKAIVCVKQSHQRGADDRLCLKLDYTSLCGRRSRLGELTLNLKSYSDKSRYIN